MPHFLLVAERVWTILKESRSRECGNILIDSVLNLTGDPDCLQKALADRVQAGHDEDDGNKLQDDAPAHQFLGAIGIVAPQHSD